MSAPVEQAAAGAPAPARVRKGWDIGLTITLDVLTAIGWFVGAFISYLGIAFFGSCSSNGCSGQAIIDGGLVAAVVGAVGIVVSIVLLILRRRGWPIALIAFFAVGIVWIAANVIDGIR